MTYTDLLVSGQLVTPADFELIEEAVKATSPLEPDEFDTLAIINPALRTHLFFNVAKLLWRLGFKSLIAIRWDDPKGKQPRDTNWNDCKELTPAEIAMMSMRHPNDLVGFASKRGSEFLVIDVDGAGTVERLEKQIGEKLPETLIWSTRPKTAPYKQHIILRQTPYLNEQIVKERSIADQCGYDLKATGAGGQVIVAGCPRFDEAGNIIEVRTSNGFPVDKIPFISERWVDGLKQDTTAGYEKRKHLNQDKRMEDHQRFVETMKALGVHDLDTVKVNVIEKGRRTTFLESLACSLLRLRVEREVVYKQLLRQCEQFCEEGEAYSRSKEGRRKIRQIAFDPRKHVGALQRVWTKVYVEQKPGLAWKEKKQEPSKVELLLPIAESFPDEIRAADAYASVGLNSTLENDRQAFRGVMRKAGFKCLTPGRHSLWVRSQLGG